MAEGLLREALALNRDVLGREHEQVALVLADLAEVLTAQNEYEQATQAYREALAIRRRLLGENHLQVAETLRALGPALQASGEVTDATVALEEALEIYRQLQAEDVPAALEVRRALADALITEGLLDQAEPLSRDALIKTRALYGDEHLDTALAIKTLGRLMIERGQLPEAEASLRRALEICTGLALREEDAWRIADIEGALGRCLTAAERFEEGETLLSRSYAAILAAKGDTFAGTRAAVQGLIELHDAWGQPGQAARWRAELAMLPGNLDEDEQPSPGPD